MGRNQYWAGRVYDLCFLVYDGTPEGSTESGFMEKRESNCDPKKTKLFVAFPWVETSTGPGLMICVFINMTGTPEGSTESGFMEKPGIEPATRFTRHSFCTTACNRRVWIGFTIFRIYIVKLN